MKPLVFYRYKRHPMLHQRREFEMTKDAEYWGYAHDMGTGKTKIIFDRAQYLYRQGKIAGFLIIAPKGVHEDHIAKEVPKDFNEQLPYIKAYYSASANKAETLALQRLFKPGPGLRILALNTDSVRTKKGYTLITKFLEAFPSLMVIDESSDFANDGTERSKALLSLSHKAKYRAWLDGTPINQGPLDLYVPCEFLKPGLLGFPTFASFKARYAKLGNGALQRDIDILVCQTRAKYKRKYEDEWEDYLTHDDMARYQNELHISKQIYLANLESKKWSIDRLLPFLPKYLDGIVGALLVLLHKTPLFVNGFKNIEELKERIRPFTSRVELTDVVDMPPFEETNVYYELSAKHRELYTKLVKDYLIHIQETGEIMSVESVLTLYGRLQQLLGGFWKSDDDKDKWRVLPGNNDRLDVLVGLLNKIDHKYKVLIAAKYVEEIKLIEYTLKKTYGEESTVTYYGENSDEEQRDAKDQLSVNPSCRYFVMNPASGAKGLNLISANYLINFSRMFSYAKEKQLFARIYRTGQQQNCFKINIICRNTMDDKVIAPALESKKDIADFIVNDISKFI
jgi:SNF2 family DNA or RNA helicase